ncbi:unnamed protein product [Lampetra planeri]
MLPRATKEALAPLRISWKLLFQGRYLLITNTLSGGGTLALGDILQQTWEISKDKSRVRNWRRTGRMFLVGCTMGPVLHVWYTWLDKVYVGKALKTVGKKVLLDQLIVSPAFGMWYFLGMSVMEGHTLSEGWLEFKSKFWEFYKADCTVWPTAQVINFYFLSPKFRVLYVNTVTLGWDIYLSYLKHRDEGQPSERVSDSGTTDVQQETQSQCKPLEDKA